MANSYGEPPLTGAGRLNSFTFEVASWETFAPVIPGPTLGSITKHHDELTEAIRLRIPRGSGDGILTIQLDDLPQLRILLGCGIISIEDIQQSLGPEIVQQVEQCERRQWEQENGYGDYTDCVKVVPAIQVRVGLNTSLLKCFDNTENRGFKRKRP